MWSTAREQLHPAAFQPHRTVAATEPDPARAPRLMLPGKRRRADAAPPADWLADVRRALLVFGPGIGIGDELILAPLPQMAQGGEPAAGGHDAVRLRGFLGSCRSGRSPAAVPRRTSSCTRRCAGWRRSTATTSSSSPTSSRRRSTARVAVAGRAETFLEISLGARTVHVFDSRRRWLYRLLLSHPYFANYYHASHQRFVRSACVRNRGSASGGWSRRGTEGGGPAGCLRQPFTSKYESLGATGARLLNVLAAQHPVPYPRLSASRHGEELEDPALCHRAGARARADAARRTSRSAWLRTATRCR